MLIFFALLLLLLVTSPRLRVYFRVTVVEAQLVRVSPDGVQSEVPLPQQLRRVVSPTQSPVAVMADITRHVRSSLQMRIGPEPQVPGMSLKLIFRYADNSSILDHQQEVTLLADGTEQ